MWHVFSKHGQYPIKKFNCVPLHLTQNNGVWSLSLAIFYVLETASFLGHLLPLAVFLYYARLLNSSSLT